MRHRTTDTPKGHRNYVIIACDVLLFLAMLKWLPVEPEVARGLAVLTFIGILWLTEFCSNTASAALVAPLMVTVASAMGMSATPLVLLVGIGASCAFMLPVSTPPNALAFATGKFPQMTMVKVGLLINVVLVFVKAFWAWIFWM